MMMRLVLVALAAAPAHASIASPHPYQEKQPDGSTVTLKIHGDEEFHYESDAAGFPVVREKASMRIAQSRAHGGHGSPTGMTTPARSSNGGASVNNASLRTFDMNARSSTERSSIDSLSSSPEDVSPSESESETTTSSAASGGGQLEAD